jgi:hypothetical protein
MHVRDLYSRSAGGGVRTGGLRSAPSAFERVEPSNAFGGFKSCSAPLHPCSSPPVHSPYIDGSRRLLKKKKKKNANRSLLAFSICFLSFNWINTSIDRDRSIHFHATTISSAPEPTAPCPPAPPAWAAAETQSPRRWGEGTRPRFPPCSPRPAGNQSQGPATTPGG